MIVVIDNYDSFTYNLVQYLGELGADPWVFRNDRVTVGELESMAPSHVVISPGPGTPERDAGVSNKVIRQFHGRVPILGVCLGHQCIAHVEGGRVRRAPRLMHGKTSRIIHHGSPLFAGIPTTFEATRYHSLVVEEPLPEALQALARTADGELMAIGHRTAPTYGVQFHPESILSPHGKRLLRNFLALGAPSQGTTADATVSDLDLPAVLTRILDGEHLTAEEAEAVMGRIMEGQVTQAQIGALLAALRAKGETVPEIVGFVRAMRRYATPVPTTRRPLVDTCGTGGDGAHTFNVSTVAALVVAGAGVAVAKHGNRSVSSRCGSADVLQALGVNVELEPEAVGRCIDEVGFGFLYAPRLHPAMKHAIGPRREMGVRTVFNLLGPLTNPAGAGVQIVGVYSPDLVAPVAHVLQELGAEAACVVNSAGGLDELSAEGANRVAMLREGIVSLSQLEPAGLGLERCPAAALRGGDAADNAAIARAILAGERGPRRDVVVLNAGMALALAGAADDLSEGIARAAEALDSGAARRVLDGVIALSGGQA